MHTGGHLLGHILPNPRCRKRRRVTGGFLDTDGFGFGDIPPLDHHVWDQWFDDLMEDIGDLMEDPSSLEDTLEDLLEDMSPDGWAQVLEDVLDPFDLDAFVT